MEDPSDEPSEELSVEPSEDLGGEFVLEAPVCAADITLFSSCDTFTIVVFFKINVSSFLLSSSFYQLLPPPPPDPRPDLPPPVPLELDGVDLMATEADLMVVFTK